MAMIAEQADHDIHAVEATFDIWPANRRDHVSVFGAMQNTRRQSYYGSDMDPVQIVAAATVLTRVVVLK